MESTLNLPENAHFCALKFLEIAMKTYPGAAGIGKTVTEKFILSFVDSQNEALVTQSAKCLHLLQQTRGGGAHSSAHKLAWTHLQLCLLGSIHELLNGIYSNTSEIVDGFTGTERLAIAELQLSDEPILRTLQLVTRFKNLCRYLQVVLLYVFFFVIFQ